MLQKLYARISVRTMFLIDFTGAVLTIFSYVLIHFYFKDRLGFSNYMIRVLMGAAVLYALYSLSMYFIQPKKWMQFLRLIAYANLLFCGIAMKFLFSYFDNLTFLGKTYLIVETVLVFGVVLFELFYIEANNEKHLEP